MLIYQILAFLIILLGSWIAVWVFIAGRRSKINQVFSIFTISFLLWAPLPYFFNLPRFSSIALHLVRFGYGMVSLFLVCFYFFAIFFPKVTKRNLFLEKIIFLIGIVFFFLSFSTNIVVENIENTKWGINPLFGRGKIFYFGWVFLITLISIGLLFRKYKLLTKKEKLQVQYVFIGVLVFVIPNLIFNVIFPFLGKTAQVRFYPFGNYSAIFLLGFTAYAIVKRELFGIRVVLTEILVAFIAILLFLQVIISKSTFEYIWKSLLLILFLVFGYSLVKSVIREIKYREQLQRAFEKLKELDKAKSEFISIASHQLRTPLTAIKGYISMILEGSYGEISEKIKRPLESVYKSNERLIKLVNDLLNISRIESGKIELKVAPFSIEEIIKSVIEELKIEAEKKKIYLKFEELKKKLPKIKIDGEKIRQVILNVIDNAIRYTDKGGVKVKAYKINDKIRIEVSDTGAGMTKEELSKIFESFSRAGAGTRLYTEGVGLGLYVARRFVEMHNGKIWAESPGKGKGSTFFIELPIK